MNDSRNNQPHEHYFSILNDNLPGLDMIIIDRNLNIQLALGNEIRKRKWNNPSFPAGNLKETLIPSIYEIFEPVLRIALSGTKVSTELFISGKYFSLQIIPDLKSSAGDRSFLIIVQDITDEKLREEQLKLSKNEAEEANRAKSEFIANMSHEIRTPLNAINGFSEQLLKTRLNKKQSHFLDIVLKASHHLISIINDILLLSRFDAGKTHLEEAPFSLKVLLDDVEKVVEFRYREKGIKFSCRLDPELELVFLGDAGKIRQILINIISNAIKFTSKGSVEMDVRSVRPASEIITVEFEIKDTGIGIPEDKLEEIFEPFKQVDSAVNRRYSGTGLGLTISRKMVENMGGSINVKSTVGEGTTFHVALPMHVSESQQIPGKERTHIIRDRKKFRTIKVLLVDDDSVNRLLGEVVLKNFGIKPVLATDGEEAIRKFRVGRFDLILLDIQMPVISGLDVARHIRLKEKGKAHRCHIIAVTANVLKKDIDIYLSKGIDDYILKPFTEQSIFNKLNHHFGKMILKSSAAGIKSENETDGKSGRSYDLSELYRISGNDEEFVKMMLSTFMENADESLSLMEKALSDEDFVRIGEIAHKLHPSFQQLGMTDAYTSLKDLENRFIREKDYKRAGEVSREAFRIIFAAVSDLREHYMDTDR